jgi:hypothetical protein
MTLSAHIATSPTPSPILRQPLRVIGTVNAGDPSSPVIYETPAPYYGEERDYDMVTDEYFPMPDLSLVHERIYPGDRVYVKTVRRHMLNHLDFVGWIVLMVDRWGRPYLGRYRVTHLETCDGEITTGGLRFFGAIYSIEHDVECR